MERHLLLTQALEVRALKTELRRASLLLQLRGLLLLDTLLLIQVLAVLRQARLLLGDELLLTLRREALPLLLRGDVGGRLHRRHDALGLLALERLRPDGRRRCLLLRSRLPRRLLAALWRLSLHRWRRGLLLTRLLSARLRPGPVWRL